MRTLQGYISWCARAQWTLAGVTAALLAAFYFVEYRPNTQQLARMAQAEETARAEFRENQVRSSVKAEITAHNVKLRQQLDRIRKPSQQAELPQLIKDLAMYGQQASLKNFNYKPGMPGRSDLFCELPISLTFEGDFMNVFSFLRSTEDMQRLTRVRSLTLKSRDGKAGQVQAQVSMNIYFATE